MPRTRHCKEGLHRWKEECVDCRLTRLPLGLTRDPRSVEEATLGIVLDVFRLVRALRERGERNPEVLAMMTRLERRVGLAPPEVHV